jgi:ligand-binding SRPBCC domain-containing protein
MCRTAIWLTEGKHEAADNTGNEQREARMTTVRLTFKTEVPASVAEVWTWSTSIRGIKAEMWPILKITFPKGMTHIGEDTALDKPLCRCQFLLLGIVPIDMSKLTFVEIDPGHRFVEQSPLLSMRSWRHERVVTPLTGESTGTLVTDNLEFSPRFATPLVRFFLKKFFQHRHAVLARSFPLASAHRSAGAAI